MRLPNVLPRSRRAEAFAIGLVVAAAFVFLHPYTGIRHDSTLYAGDALIRLLPGQFRDDLYFLFGSQGRFTLLPAAYAALISAFGLGTGTIVGMLAAFALYLAATTMLVSALLPPRLRAFGVLSVALGWTLYGGERVFGYSEAFVTARSFAEPAVLAGLALLVHGRRVAAAVLLVVALLVHPLIAAGGFLAAWLYLLQSDRRWIAAAAVGIVALAVLGAIGAGPFNDVFSRYDAVWLALVREVNPQAFVTLWSVADYGTIVFNAAVLWLATRLVADGPLRRMAIAVGIAGIGATVASLVLVDLVGSSFFGKLQIWRAEWIMQWMAMAVLPFVVDGLCRRPGQHGRTSAGFLAMGWMAPFSPAVGVLAAIAVVIDAARHRFVVSSTTTRIVWTAVALVGVAVVVQHESHVLKFGALLHQPIASIVGQALAVNVLVALAAAALLVVVPRLGWAGPILALSVFAVAMGFWDQRGVWTRKLESYATGTHIWPGVIEPTAKVYWYRDLIAPWVLLGHGNYYTQQQGSGAVFSRDMVVELDRRRKVTAILDFQEQICRMMNNLSEAQGSCEPDVEAVDTVCRDGGIDYIVLQSTLAGVSPAGTFSTGVVENGYEKRFFLYRCAALARR
jgi:hypothetical protein